MSEYNGRAKNGKALSVQHFPGRKRGALCIGPDSRGVCHELATFKDEDCEEIFLDALFAIAELDVVG